MLVLAALTGGVSSGATRTANGTTSKVPGTSYLLAVACRSTGACIVVGKPSLGSRKKGGVFVSVSNGMPGAVQTVDGTEGLYHVACPSANQCIALGRSFSAGLPQEVYVDISNGQAGPVRRLDGMTEIASIGCGNQTSCWAPGGDCNAANRCTPKVAHIVNGKLDKVYSETGSYSFSTGAADTEDAERGPTPACSSATVCTLAGASNVDHPAKSSGLIFSLSDGHVKVAHRVTAVSLFSGLACPSKNYCTLVGYKSSSVKSEVLTWAGGKSRAPKSVDASVGPLACKSATACFAFGFERTGSSGERVIVPIERGKPAAPESLPSESSKPDIYAAACTASRCVGVGNVGQYPRPIEGWVFGF